MVAWDVGDVDHRWAWTVVFIVDGIIPTGETILEVIEVFLCVLIGIISLAASLVSYCMLHWLLPLSSWLLGRLHPDIAALPKYLQHSLLLL